MTNKVTTVVLIVYLSVATSVAALFFSGNNRSPDHEFVYHDVARLRFFFRPSSNVAFTATEFCGDLAIYRPERADITIETT